MATKDFRQFPCAYIWELRVFVAHCAVGMLVQDTACAGLFWIFNYPVEVHGSNLKCCFEDLENNSVSYQLNEPPGPSCTTIWSDMNMVLVDENGDVDQKTVVYLESQKLILRQNMEEKDKLVTYRKDCHLSGYAYEAECRDPCAAVDVTKSIQVTNSTVAPNGNKIICIIIISSSIIITIIVIVTIICCKRKYCSPPNVRCRAMWTAVPKNASTQV